MELNYSFKIKTTNTKSALKEAGSPVGADIYLNKKFNWLNYNVSFNSDSDLVFESELISKENLNNKTIFKVNTLNGLLTNVVVDNVPYYYELVVKEDSSYTLDSLIIDLNMKDVVEYNNKFYTNTKNYVFNSELDFVFTRKVLDLKDCTVFFRPDYIEIEAPVNSELLLGKYVIEPQIINQYSYFLPSFYLKTSTNDTIQCIESDIKIFESKINSKLADYLKYKVEDTLSNEYVLEDFNVTLKAEDTNTKCRYRLSSHCLVLPEFEGYYLVDADGTFKTGTKNDYTFKVSKNIDVDYIDVIPNSYKYLSNDFEELRSSNIISYKEVNSDLNNFGTTYNAVENIFPQYNYINEILFTNFSFKENSRLKTKSLKVDAVIFKVLDNTESLNKNFIQCDDINYFIKE